MGHANWFLKTCKKILANHLIGPDGGRLPTQRVRNALCRGVGYNSYDELKFIMAQHPDWTLYPASPDDLQAAFAKGISLALAVAEGYGFRPPEPTDAFALRHAKELVQGWY
jgi:hypothetical protein